MLISAGRVSVNGQVAHLGQKADSASDRIEVDGKIIKNTKLIYIMVNKPKDVVSSTEDELNQNRRTVRDLVSLPGHLYPVGRLDKQSEGLMLLTNDGALTHRLTHPRYGHAKIYEVQIEGDISSDMLKLWRTGVMLDGRKTAPAEIKVLGKSREKSTLLIRLKEGRKRQIRRVAAILGHPVTRLVRRQIGPLKLGDLEPGDWRHLTTQEVTMLISSVNRRKD